MDHSQNHIHGQSAANLCYQFGSDNPFFGMGVQQPFAPFTTPFGASPSTNIPHMDWNPPTMLDNLTFIEEKIRQVKGVIRTMVDHGSQCPGELAQKQQVVNADLTCLIVQLISTAGSLLPSLKNSTFLSHPQAGHMGIVNHVGSSSSFVPNVTAISEENKEEMCSPEDYEEFFKGFTDGTMEGGIEIDNVLVEEQDAKDANEGGDAGMDGESLPPGSYELLQLEKDEILAPHTHFCSICGKGFKRDANLRMHMRGHGDEYKSPAALAKPPRDASAENELVKRYSCPFVGCKRNKLHKNFLPLKTILCVKNHYKRSHCEKSYTCSRCHTKKFSVMADLKTHEKHCGRDKWLCSCGTSFSRKDKLFAHVALFQGHTPALPTEEPKTSSDQIGRVGSHQEPAKLPSSMGSSFVWGTSSGNENALGIKGVNGCSDDFLSTANFGSFSFSFGPADGFTGEPSGSSFSMLPSEHFQSAQKKGEELDIDNLRKLQIALMVSFRWTITIALALHHFPL